MTRLYDARLHHDVADAKLFFGIVAVKDGRVDLVDCIGALSTSRGMSGMLRGFEIDVSPGLEGCSYAIFRSRHIMLRREDTAAADHHAERCLVRSWGTYVGGEMI